MQEPIRQAPISKDLELGNRKLSRAVPRVPRNKREIALLSTRKRPTKIVRGDHRLPAFVNTQECDIEIVTREHEIVWIPTEKGDREFRGKNQANILEPAIFVQVIPAA